LKMSHKLEVVRHSVAIIFSGLLACRTSLSQVSIVCDNICDTGDQSGDRLRSRLDIRTGHVEPKVRADSRRLLKDLLREYFGSDPRATRASEDARPHPSWRCSYRHPVGSTGTINDRSVAHRGADLGSRSWLEIAGRTVGRHHDPGRQDDPDDLRCAGRLRANPDQRPDILRESSGEGQRGKVRTAPCPDPGAGHPCEGASGDEIGIGGRSIVGSSPSDDLPSAERLNKADYPEAGSRNRVERP